VYVENSAVRVLPVENLKHERFLGRRIGHILMSRDQGFKINAPGDVYRLGLVGRRLQQQGTFEGQS
jgi:hypothetical protein